LTVSSKTLKTLTLPVWSPLGGNAIPAKNCAKLTDDSAGVCETLCPLQLGKTCSTSAQEYDCSSHTVDMISAGFQVLPGFSACNGVNTWRTYKTVRVFQRFLFRPSKNPGSSCRGTVPGPDCTCWAL
jgi:hypothetical protein